MYKMEIYKRAFWDSIRGEKHENDIPILNKAVDNSGAPILPQGSEQQYTKALAKDNLFRRLATVMRIPQNSTQAVAVESIGTADWMGEGVAFPESEDSFISHSFKTKKIAGLAKFKTEFIQDTNLDLESYILSHFARRFGKTEEQAFLTGNGIDAPSGLLHDTKGAQVGGIATGSSPTLDEVNTLFFSLKPEYRSKAVWIMKDETLLHLRSLKDASGSYLWRGEPDTLNGRPVVVSNHMPSAAPGSKPIAFGDLSYYWVMESAGLSIKALTELYASQGMVGIIASEHLDGRLIRPEAVKALKMGA